MPERFTQSEASRIVGVDPSRLRYWRRLRLVVPQARWGEHFYNFTDLVALRSIKTITERRIPARKLLRAVAALQGSDPKVNIAIGGFRLFPSGREIAAIPPGATEHAIEPLTGQFVLPFHAGTAAKVRQMESHAADQLFEYAVRCEGRPEGLDEAMRVYQQVIEMQPRWSEPHINLGCVYYQRGEMQNAQAAFCAALEREPDNVVAHFNLGCVLDEIGRLEDAIEHLRRATELEPTHADAHFNLASAYEKQGRKQLALQHWILYLQQQSHGPWADFARTQLKESRVPRTPAAPIPFRPHDRN
ncbi:MAG: tetratricopeptide repeat protein [Candidatus Acidiferrales bacterium]